MIEGFVKAWDANKDKLRVYFMNEESDGDGSYMMLVKTLFEVVINPYLKEQEKDTYDTERIHEIDDGDYQGTLLYVIPVKTYQPSFDEYVLTYAYYGSCPVCDILQGIWEHNHIGTREETADSLMKLCLHLLQRCKIPYSPDERIGDSDWTVREMTEEEAEQLDKASEGKPFGKMGKVVFQKTKPFKPKSFLAVPPKPADEDIVEKVIDSVEKSLEGLKKMIIQNMDKNTIALQENGNDGQSVFLYYDAMAGVYLAYGLSAYYTTMVTDPYMSYSEEMEMPVALLRRNHINDLRQSLKKVEHTEKQYYRFQLRQKVGKEGYERWMQGVLARHNVVR